MNKLAFSTTLFLLLISVYCDVYPTLKLAIEPSITDTIKDDLSPLIKNATSKPINLGNTTMEDHVKDVGTLTLDLNNMVASDIDIDLPGTHFLVNDITIQISKFTGKITTDFEAKLGILRDSG